MQGCGFNWCLDSADNSISHLGLVFHQLNSKPMRNTFSTQRKAMHLFQAWRWEVQGSSLYSVCLIHPVHSEATFQASGLDIPPFGQPLASSCGFSSCRCTVLVATVTGLIRFICARMDWFLTLPHHRWKPYFLLPISVWQPYFFHCSLWCEVISGGCLLIYNRNPVW